MGELAAPIAAHYTVGTAGRDNRSPSALAGLPYPTPLEAHGDAALTPGSCSPCRRRPMTHGSELPFENETGPPRSVVRGSPASVFT